MSGTRNQIYEALAELLATIKGATVSRKVKYWDEYSAADMPVIIIKQEGETHFRTGQSMPDKTTLNASLWVYLSIPQDQNPPSEIVNDFLKIILDKLAPDPYPNTQTLGGLCFHCWVEGEMLIDTGDIDGIAMAIVPIRILVP